MACSIRSKWNMNNFVAVFYFLSMTSEQRTIDHEGIVESVSGDMARVMIRSATACSTCHAKGACGAADGEDKILDVPIGNTHFTPGEPVRVSILRRAGIKAVMLGYVWPFFLVFILLITLTTAGVDELRSGLISLLSLIPYYTGIFLFRKRISHAFTFKLEKSNNNI